MGTQIQRRLFRRFKLVAVCDLYDEDWMKPEAMGMIYF